MSTSPRVFSLLLLAAAGTASGQVLLYPGGAPPMVTMPGDRGAVSFSATGLPAEQPAKAVMTAQGEWLEVHRGAPGNPGTAFSAAPFATQRITWSNDQAVAVAAFTARTADGAPVELRIVDSDGNVRCRNGGSLPTATCVAEIPHRTLVPTPTSTTRAVTLRVEAESRGQNPTTVHVAGFWSPNSDPTQALELQSPPRTDRNGALAFRMPYTIRMNRPFAPQGYLLSLQHGDGTRWRSAVAAIQRDGSEQSAAYAVLGVESPSGVRASTLQSAASEHRNLVFLVPANAGTITVEASTLNGLSTGVTPPAGAAQDIELSLHRWSRNPDGSDVLPVPAGRVPEYFADRNGPVLTPGTARETIVLDGARMEPGLWYAVPRSRNGQILDMRLTVDYAGAARTLEPQPGHYHNPSRPGHGFFLSPVGEDWVLVWYTYDNAGRPIWYYARAPRPNGGSRGALWIASLYRNVWDGTTTRFQFAGVVQLAAIAPDRLTVLHLLNGRVGTESVQRLGDGRCVQQPGGQALDVNGLWHSPGRPGYGFSIEFIGGTEFYLAHAFDGKGQPRWLTAQQTRGAATLPLIQTQGSCPSCPPAVGTRRIVGTLERRLGPNAAPDGAPGVLMLGLDAQFVDGVPGRWQERRPVELLSRRTGCPNP